LKDKKKAAKVIVQDPTRKKWRKTVGKFILSKSTFSPFPKDSKMSLV